jgi:MinD superfamily P-loop ATPase
VTEPTVSGIHDLKRIYDVACHFQIPAVLCINKFDVNLDNSKKIEDYCESNNINVVGKLPYDLIMTRAMVEEKSVIEFSNESSLYNGIIKMWEVIRGRLDV